MPDFNILSKELDSIQFEDSVTEINALVGFRNSAEDFLNRILGILFPSLSGTRQEPPGMGLSAVLPVLENLLNLQKHNLSLANDFFVSLPQIKKHLISDAGAILNGDPAAKSIEEVLICYPGFYAICVYRLAHQLEKLGIHLLARYFSEYAHSKTGIDIHPGAQIGQSFCIDHGTGIVIGETTIIGNDVKLYHGVTLGGLSVLKSQATKKRHPTIEDNVVIYSNAVILGGETVIGHDSIIGGNVWLTHSVDSYSLVEQQKQQHTIKARKLS